MENGLNGICKDLIKDNIPSPARLNNSGNNSLWNSTTIRRILKNEVYIGNTIGHKVKKINYKLKKQILLDKDEWIKVENTHDTIISKEDFEKVQNILNKRSYNPQKRQCTFTYRNYILCKLWWKIYFYKRIQK